VRASPPFRCVSKHRRTLEKQVRVRGGLLFRYSRETLAAVMIQSLTRGFLARLAATAKMNWLTYNILDNNEEKVRQDAPASSFGCCVRSALFPQLHIVRSQTLEGNLELQDALESKKRSFRILTTAGRMESLSARSVVVEVLFLRGSADCPVLRCCRWLLDGNFDTRE
jgi:hypothetical protein